MNDNAPIAPVIRRRLDNRRPAERIAFVYRNEPCSALVGFRVNGLHPDGHLVAEIGDVFIDGGKIGSDIQSTAVTGAIILSHGLQRGADIRDFAHSIPRLPDGEPTDIVGAAIDAVVKAFYPERAHGKA